MIDFQPLLQQLATTDLAPLAKALPAALAAGLSIDRYGDLPAWYTAMRQLPDIAPSSIDLANGVVIGQPSDASPTMIGSLEDTLRALIPWRKGPFDVFGIHIDTEWRSDWKWQRVLPHLSPLTGRTVLDVGCGNGYHTLRIGKTVGEAGKVRLVETPAVTSPIAFGLTDKVIALPPRFMAMEDRHARDLAIAHELAHHERPFLPVAPHELRG